MVYNAGMKKWIITFLSLLLFALLTVTGLLLFLFSDSGNAILKPYLKEKLEHEIGMPVEINSYTLRSGSSKMDVTINHTLRIKVVSRFSVWKRSFEGLYHIVAHNFEYKGSRLRQADIRGHFRGVAENIYADGNGTALDAPLWYRLRVVDESVRQLEAQMQGLSLAEVLALSKQPPLAQGRADLRVDMPRIGEEGAKGNAHLVVHDATLNRALIKQLYAVDLPRQSALQLKADAQLEGKELRFVADAKSDLFAAKIKEGSIDLANKKLTAAYWLDTKALQVLTAGRLAGALQVEGSIKAEGKEVSIDGVSHSLGGILQFQAGDKIRVTMQKLQLSKLLAMLKQPYYIRGEIDGSVDIPDKSMRKGSYRIQIPHGILNAAEIRKRLGYAIPQATVLSLKSEGRIKEKVLNATTTVTSKVATLKLKETRYDIKRGKLVTGYLLTLYDPGLLMGKKPSSKAGKVKPVTTEGKLRYDGRIAVSGSVKGLGKRVAYSYDGISAKLDAVSLYVGKVLSLANLPAYVRGNADVKLHISDLKALNGTFALHGKNLQTSPGVMKQLIGKPLKMKLALDATGKLKAQKAYGKATLRTALGTLQLPSFVAAPKQGSFQTPYTLKIPDLTRLYALTGTKLYGSMLTSGKISKGKILTINGTTASLGGKVNYTLAGNRFTAQITAVPLPNILRLMGYAQNFLGTASGKGRYNLKSQKGTADLSIASFQIKPSALTNALKAVIGKDPSRIIFKSTTFHANINRDIVTYLLHAKGSYSSIDITDGYLNKKTGAQRAKLKFVYGKHTIYGKIKGTLEHPKIQLDAEKIVKEKLKKKIRDKVQKKLEKALGGQAGALLRGLGL